MCFIETFPSLLFVSYARFRFEQSLKCRSDFLDEISGGCGSTVLREGLSCACAGQARRCPACQNACARVRTLRFYSIAPVHKDSASAGEDITLPATSGKEQIAFILPLWFCDKTGQDLIT